MSENFKTLPEMMRALLNGKKICHNDWHKDKYGMMTDEALRDSEGNPFGWFVGEHICFKIWETPKVKVRYTLCAVSGYACPIFLNDNCRDEAGKGWEVIKKFDDIWYEI